MEDKKTSNVSTELETGISVTIDRPPEAVFAALTNVSAHTDWAKGRTQSRTSPIHRFVLAPPGSR